MKINLLNPRRQFPHVSHGTILIVLPHGHSVMVECGWIGIPFSRFRKVANWTEQ